MEIVDHVLGIAEKLYSLCGEVQANKKRCRRLAHRVHALEEIVKTVKVKGLGPEPEVVQQGLQELKVTLESAHEVVKKYTSKGFLRRIVKAYDLGDEFQILNERLNDSFQLLSLALQVDQRENLTSVFEEIRRGKEDMADRENDHKDLKTLLESNKHLEKEMQEIKGMLKSLNPAAQEAELSSLKMASLPLPDIREIKLEELVYDVPKTPIMTSPSHELYKGEYNKFTVAIKRYIYTANTTPRGTPQSNKRTYFATIWTHTVAREVRSIFKKEVETMKRFESPNILRMFGICVQDENGPSPNYLIVMEFCERGSLQDVLRSGKYKLPWERRAQMSLEAAQGLYRLHQSEEKFKVHGCINSSKFLVDSGFRVKLGCFELAKTETSLRRNKKGTSTSVHYCSPQQLQSIHYSYNKECEIYSFGIVLWEIATQQPPFKDLSENEVFKKVCEEKFTEPTPEDCPKSLSNLIDTCRSYDVFHRPTAGVLVDKLRKVVEELYED